MTRRGSWIYGLGGPAITQPGLFSFGLLRGSPRRRLGRRSGSGLGRDRLPLFGRLTVLVRLGRRGRLLPFGPRGWSGQL